MRRAVLVALGLLLLCGSVEGADLHAFWDNRCAECHGHAGSFVRKNLHVAGGILKGRHTERDIEAFLAAHEAGPEMAKPIYGMMLAQAQTKPVFEQKCSGCHETAAAFARSSLTMKDGVLTGRGNGIPVATFLKRHGKLTADEIPVVLDTLARVLAETGPAGR